MKKIMNWMAKPITWGAYIKLSVVGAIISTIIMLIANIIIWQPELWVNARNFITKTFRKKV